MAAIDVFVWLTLDDLAVGCIRIEHLEIAVAVVAVAAV